MTREKAIERINNAEPDEAIEIAAEYAVEAALENRRFNFEGNECLDIEAEVSVQIDEVAEADFDMAEAFEMACNKYRELLKV
jgi:AMMECR1 domain-containing protein